MRLIDADELKACFDGYYIPENGYKPMFGFDFVNEEIDDAPTVEAKEVVHGEWIKVDGDWKNSNTGEPLTVHQCSNCRNYFIHAPYNFCPNCGADMRKKV